MPVKTTYCQSLGSTAVVFGSKCIRAYIESLNWINAHNKCLASGGNLVTIQSAAENNAVAALMPSPSTFWIGLNDRYTEGSYSWTSGEATVYFNWELGQPNGGSEDCVGANTTTGLWHDISCTGVNRTYYICEYSIGEFSFFVCFFCCCFEFFLFVCFCNLCNLFS